VAASLCTVPFNNDAGAFNGNFEARPGGVSFDFLVEPEAQIDAAGRARPHGPRRGSSRAPNESTDAKASSGKPAQN
jgi:hypothetical protein